MFICINAYCRMPIETKKYLTLANEAIKIYLCSNSKIKNFIFEYPRIEKFNLVWWISKHGTAPRPMPHSLHQYRDSRRTFFRAAFFLRAQIQPTIEAFDFFSVPGTYDGKCRFDIQKELGLWWTQWPFLTAEYSLCLATIVSMS